MVKMKKISDVIQMCNTKPKRNNEYRKLSTLDDVGQSIKLIWEESQVKKRQPVAHHECDVDSFIDSQNSKEDSQEQYQNQLSEKESDDSEELIDHVDTLR